MTSLKKLVVISEEKREGRRGGQREIELTNRLVGSFALSAKLHVWMLFVPFCFLQYGGVGGRLRDAVEEGVAEKEFRCRNSVPFFLLLALLRTYMLVLHGL